MPEDVAIKRFGQARGVLLVVLCASLLMAMAKIALGYVTASASLMADGLHSLPGDTTIAQEHEIEHRIEDRLKRNIPGVEDVFFHVEPRLQ